MARIISYNVNGIRSAMSKGLSEWLKAADPDVVCFQEIKANKEDIPVQNFEALGYKHFWYPAQKKGYSGVGILSKESPLHVEFGCGIPAYDEEGRIIRADFENFSVMSMYAPSGTTGDERQNFKYRFLDDFQQYIGTLQKKVPRLVIS